MTAPPSQRQEFADVDVVPTEALLASSRFGSEFRGGPVWPDFRNQILARHCRGAIPQPIDDPPRLKAKAVKTYDRAVWAGPAVRHFGHMIADFGMRVVESAHFEPDAPLLFSVEHGQRPKPFFYELLKHWGIPKTGVRLIGDPVLVRSLAVFPQAERRPGRRDPGLGPSEAHLDLLDARHPRIRPWNRKTIDTLYVSRSAWSSVPGAGVGALAGEAYLECALARLGAKVFHPECASLSEQLDTYATARRLIFCEGSAVHALQLLGRLDAEVVIISRRPGTKLAQASLLPRCRSLTYVDALSGLVFGLHPSGRPQKPRAIGVLSEGRFLEQMETAGFGLRRVWSAPEYRRRRDQDLALWQAKRAESNRQSPIEKLLIRHLIARARKADR